MGWEVNREDGEGVTLDAATGSAEWAMAIINGNLDDS
jgi:hypothetical protein